MSFPAGLLYSESIRSYFPHEQTLLIFPTGFLNRSVDVRLGGVVTAVDFLRLRPTLSRHFGRGLRTTSRSSYFSH